MTGNDEKDALFYPLILQPSVAPWQDFVCNALTAIPAQKKIRKNKEFQWLLMNSPYL
jgi:hypothetical protein